MSKAKKATFLTPKLAFALCASISTQGATLRDAIQTAAMAAIYHSVKSHNNDVGIRLFESMVDGLRKQSLVAYLELHGNFRWDAETKKLVYQQNPEAQADPSLLHALLSANPWYEARQEAEITSTFDVNQKVAALIKAIQKAVKSGKEIVAKGTTAEILMAVARGDEIHVSIPESPAAIDAGIASLMPKV